MRVRIRRAGPWLRVPRVVCLVPCMAHAVYAPCRGCVHLVLCVPRAVRCSCRLCLVQCMAHAVCAPCRGCVHLVLCVPRAVHGSCRGCPLPWLRAPRAACASCRVQPLPCAAALAVSASCCVCLLLRVPHAVYATNYGFCCVHTCCVPPAMSTSCCVPIMLLPSTAPAPPPMAPSASPPHTYPCPPPISCCPLRREHNHWFIDSLFIEFSLCVENTNHWLSTCCSSDFHCAPAQATGPPAPRPLGAADASAGRRSRCCCMARRAWAGRLQHLAQQDRMATLAGRLGRPQPRAPS